MSESKFKVGDRVRIVGDLDKGQCGVVVALWGSHMPYPYEVSMPAAPTGLPPSRLSGLSYTGTFAKDELELING